MEAELNLASFVVHVTPLSLEAGTKKANTQ